MLIKLNDIHISYGSNILLNNAKFYAKQGALTCIYGESGVGKTSLLYMIGMLTNLHQCHYSFQEETCEWGDYDAKENMRKATFAYVLQDNNMIQLLTIRQNIQYYLTLCDHEDDDVKSYLEKVHLDVDDSSYPSILSGGERQRLAIACALAKNTEIIIGDEITSSLDAHNRELIYGILEDITKKDGKTVILVTHDDEIVKQSYIAFRMEHQTLELVHDVYKEKNSTLDIKNSVVKNATIYHYFFQLQKHFKIKQSMMILVFVLCILCSCMIVSLNRNIASKQRDVYGAISNVELNVLNDSTPSDGEEYKSLVRSGGMELPFSDDIKNKMNTIQGVDSIYPYYEFVSQGMDETGGTIDAQVSVNGKKWENSDESSQSFDDDFKVKPYFKEQKLFENKHGVYVNQEYASRFHVKKNDRLNIKVAVPTFTQYTTAYRESNDSEEQIPFDSMLLRYKAVTLEWKVEGIVQTENMYGGYMPDQAIYISYDTMMDIMKEHEAKTLPQSIEGYGYYDTLDTPLYKVFAKQYDQVIRVKKELETLSKQIKVGYDYQDYEMLMNSGQNSKSISLGYFVFIAILLVGFMAFIRLSYFEKCKNTWFISKLNGISDKQLTSTMLRYIGTSCLCIAMIVILFAVVISIPQYIQSTEYLPLYALWSSYFLFEVWDVVYLIILLVLSSMLPLYFQLRKWKSMDVSQFIRGKKE